MLENISNIKTKIEELSSFFGFFRKNLIKQTLYRDIEYLEKFQIGRASCRERVSRTV